MAMLVMTLCGSNSAGSTSGANFAEDGAAGESAPHRPVCVREMPKPEGVWRPGVNLSSIGYVQFGIALSSDVVQCDDERREWTSLQEFPNDPYLLAVALDTFVKQIEEGGASWDDRISASDRSCVSLDKGRRFGGFTDPPFRDFEGISEEDLNTGNFNDEPRKDEIAFVFSSCGAVYLVTVKASRTTNSVPVFLEPREIPLELRICDEPPCESH